MTTEEILKALADYSTPELCDGAGLYHSMHHEIRHFVGKNKIIGTALTVDVPSGEGAIIADAILKLKEHDVLVVAGKGNCDCSYWRDHRSICAAMMKAQGVVIDGAFRDIDGCEEAGFPIFARGVTCGTALKSNTGTINVPVSCGGVNVNPGDFIVADRNGVCVIRTDEAESVMKGAMDKRLRQETATKEIRATGIVQTKVKSREKLNKI
ncbi:MAG: RraA family protein [Synergistaceae bacterium]|nr:RraA family protein [Synergistaceae bacterium]